MLRMRRSKSAAFPSTLNILGNMRTRLLVTLDGLKSNNAHMSPTLNWSLVRIHILYSTSLSGLFWWLPKIKEFPIVFYTENQLLTKSCPNIVSSRGTKMGQNLLKTYLAIFFHDVHVIKDLCYSFAKVHNYCETNEGNPLNLSFAVHFSSTCTDNGIFG